MIVHAARPVTEIDDSVRALMLLVLVFLEVFKFHFGSVFRIMNLE